LSFIFDFQATVGVGLGLPGHIPGLADINVVKEATRQSEDMLIEQVRENNNVLKAKNLLMY